MALKLSPDRNPPRVGAQVDAPAIERAQRAEAEQDVLVPETGPSWFDRALDSRFAPLVASVSICGSYLASALGVAFGIIKAGGGTESSYLVGLLAGVAVGAVAAFRVAKRTMNHEDADQRALKKQHAEAPVRGYAFDVSYDHCSMNLEQVQQIGDAALDVTKFVGEPQNTPLAFGLISRFSDFVTKHQEGLEHDYPNTLAAIVRDPIFEHSQHPAIQRARNDENGDGLSLGTVYGALLRAIAREQGDNSQAVLGRLDELVAAPSEQSESRWALGLLARWNRLFVSGTEKLTADGQAQLRDELARLAELHRRDDQSA